MTHNYFAHYLSIFSYHKFLLTSSLLSYCTPSSPYLLILLLNTQDIILKLKQFLKVELNSSSESSIRFGATAATQAAILPQTHHPQVGFFFKNNNHHQQIFYWYYLPVHKALKRRLKRGSKVEWNASSESFIRFNTTAATQAAILPQTHHP